MKLPINLGSKWIVFIAVIITMIVVAPITAKITSKVKNKEFARTEKVYMKMQDRLFMAYQTLAEKARYSISQTFTIKKNKKGQITYVPTSTMEIDRVIEDIEQNIKAPIDTIQEDTLAKEESFWDRLMFWKE